MPEIDRVDEATSSPGVCAFCRTHQGPFVRVHANLPDVAVTSLQGHLDGVDPGEAHIEMIGEFLICVGKGPDPDTGDYDNGCARLIGGYAGCATPGEVIGLNAHTAAFRERVVQLELELSEEQQKPKTVSVPELLQLLEEMQKATTAVAIVPQPPPAFDPSEAAPAL